LIILQFITFLGHHVVANRNKKRNRNAFTPILYYLQKHTKTINFNQLQTLIRSSVRKIELGIGHVQLGVENRNWFS